MDSSADPANDLTPRRASEWLIVLEEHPGDPLVRKRLEAWLAASPDNRRDWAEVNGTWAALAELAATRGGNPHSPAGWRSTRKHSRRSALAGIAVAMLALAAVMVAGPGVLVRLTADHATGTAELRVLKLDDGTDVSLGPLTAIDVDYSGEERRIRLRQGEAFFVVTPNDVRPFVVEANAVEARDIGTAFDVKANPNEIEVTVQEGIVDVFTHGSVRQVDRLRAGDSLRVGRSAERRRQRVDIDRIATWRSGQLVVDNQPVSAVVDGIRPYFAGMIVLRGDHFAQQPLTGVYNLADPISALRAVASAHGAHFHLISPWLVILGGE